MIDAAAKELDREKRLALQSKALLKIKTNIDFLPLHQQPMAWALGPRCTASCSFPTTSRGIG